ncbi:MAG: trypsin-like peptidase domain-containing protein [Chloroherpetonaceae bacterium]|nr:trypsin-like peptidase domain-containing protein [Chloroherpetonaceae bacterium]
MKYFTKAHSYLLSLNLFFIFFLLGCDSGSTPDSTQRMQDSGSLYAQVPNQNALNSSTQPAKPESNGDAQMNILTSRKNAITTAVAYASPAVVGINVTEVREYVVRDPFSLFFNDPFFSPYMNRPNRKFKQEVKSLGSGFFITKDGYIVTNSHVVNNASKVVVTTTEGKQLQATIVGIDEITDLALLKVDGEHPFLTFANSDEVMVGEWAIAIGNPFGLFDINDKPTVTVGVVSSIGLNFPDVDNRSYRGMIQTDAAINSGNSGGPLINANGEVIGVNTFIYTGGGSGSIGIGFSIPAKRVQQIIGELRAKGKIERSFRTGISVQMIDAGLAKLFDLESNSAVVVSNVEKKSPGEKAGVKAGDVILEANGVKIKSEQDVIAAIREMRAGEILKLKILREKKILDVSVQLEK